MTESSGLACVSLISVRLPVEATLSCERRAKYFFREGFTRLVLPGVTAETTLFCEEFARASFREERTGPEMPHFGLHGRSHELELIMLSTSSAQAAGHDRTALHQSSSDRLRGG